MTKYTIGYHRNGISGEGFHTLRWKMRDGQTRNMLAVVFDGNGQCAVIDMDEPEETWRGDYFEAELRAAIKAWEDRRAKALSA